MSKRKQDRNDLDRNAKIQLLHRYKELRPCSQRVAAEELKISRGCLRNLLRDEDILLNEDLDQERNGKRQRCGKDEEVEDALWKWMKFAQSRKVPVNGPILCQKALDIAQRLRHDTFTTSEGWLNRWKKRHNLIFTKLQGESTDADTDAATAWTHKEMKNLLENYTPDNIYNADETALYFRALPDSTYVKKELRKHARGVKIAKDRLTVLVCCSMAGVKQRLLVVGKSSNPRCFKNVRIFPCDYESSRKAWMTNAIWSAWLRKWDRRLRCDGRKIALVIDNCSAHADVEDLTNIHVVKLPPNTTSIIQPCDQGIIHALKAHCRFELRARIIDEIDAEHEATACQIAKRLNVLDALHMMAGAWVKVSETTIRNCWKKAKFDSSEPVLEADPTIPTPAGMTRDSFDSWVEIDNDAPVSSELTVEEEEEELMSEISSGKPSDEIVDMAQDESDSEVEETPSNGEMLQILHRLRIGLEHRGFESMEQFRQFDSQVRELLRKQPMKQLKLDSFWK